MSPSERIKPVSAKQGESELLACLVLVAPSGMTADDRQAWIRVARETLKGIPADLLERGCKRARETCRFVSEIVPTIMETVGETWRRRKLDYEIFQHASTHPVEQRKEPEYIQAAEMRKLIKSIGSAA